MKRYASRLVRALYEESDSPLRYHINMLGGRSQQDLWVNQAQLFSEVHRLVSRNEARFRDGRGYSHPRGYQLLRDVLAAARTAFGEAWGDNRRFMVTRDVTLKALVRVSGDVVSAEATLGGELDAAALRGRLAPWSNLARDFRREGFYERFAARGQLERVEKIRRRLAQEASLGATGVQPGRNRS
jgi:hypothetical protein